MAPNDPCLVQPLDLRGTRRQLLGGVAALTAALPFGLNLPRGVAARSQADATAASLAEKLTIDLVEEPDTLDPALSYDENAWSVVHSIYDSLLQFSSDGEIEYLLAESYEAIDPLTVEIRLRRGVTFHDGTLFDAASVVASVAHILDETVASQVRGNFSVIEEVQTVDASTVRLILSRPALWLPAQIAAWLVMIPPSATADSLAANPVGTGPFVFGGWNRGERITLTANPGYFSGSPKGQAVASTVEYRFVPEGSTRVADLLSGTADLVRAVPVDQIAAVEDGGATINATPISACAWIRIPTDAEPFGDPRVRRALNLAVDVPAIVDALRGGYGRPLANFFVEGGLGFDPNLAPYAHDPDRARSLLAEAGFEDGFETTMDYATLDQQVIAEAVAGMLDEVGITLKLQAVDLAVFNGGWKDPALGALRLVTWGPMFDPFNLLNLVVSNQGFLSRYDNPNAQILIDAAASEADPAARADLYLQLGQVLHDEPAAIYLYDLTAIYGQTTDMPAWSPRADQYVIAAAR